MGDQVKLGLIGAVAGSPCDMAGKGNRNRTGCLQMLKGQRMRYLFAWVRLNRKERCVEGSFGMSCFFVFLLEPTDLGDVAKTAEYVRSKGIFKLMAMFLRDATRQCQGQTSNAASWRPPGRSN